MSGKRSLKNASETEQKRLCSEILMQISFQEQKLPRQSAAKTAISIIHVTQLRLWIYWANYRDFDDGPYMWNKRLSLGGGGQERAQIPFLMNL